MFEALLFITAFFAVLEVFLFSGFRIGFVFVDHEVGKALKCRSFSRILWGIIIADSAVLTVLCRVELTFGLPGFAKTVFYICAAVTVLGMVFCAAFLIIGKEELYNFLRVGARLLPVTLTAYGTAFFILIFPVLNFTAQLVTGTVIMTAVAAVILSKVLKIRRLKIMYKPAVFDMGDGYNVVFAANIRTTGWVAYSYKGKDYTIYDSEMGRKKSVRIHSVRIPYEHLKNNSYTVNVRKVYEDIPYGGLQGRKTVCRTVELFEADFSDGVDFIVLTD